MKKIYPYTFLFLLFFLIISISANAQNDSSLQNDLYEFSRTSAVSGRETEAINYIKSLLPNVQLKQDKLGNLYAVFGSGMPRKLITAPLDEPGYVISEIQTDGYLRIAPVGTRAGNLNHQFLEGHEVHINTAEGAVTGVSTVPSMHFERLRSISESSKKPFGWQEAFIDVGVSSSEEVEQKGIQKLDPVTLNKKPVLFGNSLIAAPSMKVKAAAIALAAVANSLRAKNIEGTVVIAWNTLELLNGKGLEAIINEQGPFDEIYRFNRFLQSDEINSNLLTSQENQADGEDFTDLTPQHSFYTPASTVDSKSQKIEEVGLASLYPYTPVETISERDVKRLIDYWLKAAGGKNAYTSLPTAIVKKNDKTYTSYTEENELVKKLVGKYGVSTSENEVREFVLSELPSWTRAKVDEKGNIIVSFGKGEKHSVFVAHMDETGYMVNSIRPDGKLVLESRGGMLPWIWEAQPAIIHATNNEIKAVFEPRENYLEAENRNLQSALIVNAGFSSAEDARAAGIQPGQTSVTMPKEMLRLSENKATARGFDDRVGCAALLQSIKNINPGELHQKVTFIWSVEEEIGLNGSTFAAQNLKDASIVYPIDTYVSSDDPYTQETFAGCPLGEGAVIRVLESINFVSRDNLKKVTQLAQKNGIKTQYGMTAGGTDGQAFLGYGIPSIPLSWPGRYSHSPVELMDFRDMQNLVNLIEVLVKQ